MSFKNALTKMGLVEDTTSVTKTKGKAKETTKTPTTFVAPPTTSTEVDTTISKALEESLQDNKLSGFDYLKFISATEAMKSYNTPEETRFKMTAEAAKQVGVDKDSLVKSAQHYIDVLKQNEADFESDFAQPEKKAIQTKEGKIADLETKIATLTKQLEQAKQDSSDLTTEVQEKKSNLDNRRASFQATLQSFIGTIEANTEKINKYLP